MRSSIASLTVLTVKLSSNFELSIYVFTYLYILHLYCGAKYFWEFVTSCDAYVICPSSRAIYYAELIKASQNRITIPHCILIAILGNSIFTCNSHDPISKSVISNFSSKSSLSASKNFQLTLGPFLETCKILGKMSLFKLVVNSL